MIEKVRSWLKGKKTYISAVAAIIAAIIEFANGVEASVVVQQIITAILAMTIRARISKKKRLNRLWKFLRPWWLDFNPTTMEEEEMRREGLPVNKDHWKWRFKIRRKF